MARKFKTPITLDELGSASSQAIAANVDGDSQNRINIDAGGKITWGSGSATGDTTLYRSAADTLKTDDAFTATSLAVTGQFTFPTSDGSADQVITTNGSGTLTWSDVSANATVSDTAPSSPATGQIWYESDTGKTFVYYDSFWIEVGASPPASPFITDLDEDTKIQVEESSDEDKIRFDTAGSERMIIDASGNVGIGTASPSELLDINAGTAGSVELTTTGGRTIQLTANDAEPYLSVGSTTSHSAAIMTNGVRRLTVNSSGLVGIGATNPSAELDIKGASNPEIRLQSTDSSDPFLYFGDQVDPVRGGIGYDTSANTLQLRGYNNSTRVAIDSSGNVGIGTTSPGAALDVVGTINSDGMYVSSSSAITIDVTDATYPKIGNYYSSSDQLEVGSMGGIDFVVDFNGNTAEVFNWRSGGTAGAGTLLMQLDESGQLGIGTSSQGYKLYVSGTLRSTGYSYFDVAGYFDSNNNTTPLYVTRNGFSSVEAIGIGVTDRDGYIYMNQDETSGASYLHISVNGQSGSTQRIYMDDNLYCGFVSKSSGSFTIDHPIPEMSDTHYLRHSFVEGPQADNLYRGRATLVDGTVSVNIDDAAGMTEGTFVLLNRDVQCWVTNNSGWTAVRGSVSGNILTIEAQDLTCADSVSWLVIGERQDQHMYDTDWTDEEGHIIVEPEKDDPSIAPRTLQQYQAEVANQEAN